ncbi:MAG: hypothetical protein HQM16_13810 [Deltaproteobacteria bacterium]|nr:hypothetical protein [Deltaproteobacteria bacterium]
MSKTGQNNIVGIEAQQWAALSLYLQYLSDLNFDRIELEPEDFHDFNLVFKDGHKIICESKCTQDNFTYANLKEALSSTLKKHEVNERDVILIVCSNLSEQFEGEVKWLKYLPEKYTQKFKDKTYTDDEIALIPRVAFWKIAPEINKELCYALLSEYFDFWVPAEDLIRFTDALKQYFNEAASKGSVFSRAKLREKIFQLAKETVKKTGYYDEKKRNPEQMAQCLVEALEDNSDPIWSEYPISALSTQPYLLHYVFQRIKNKENIDLEKWDDLWKLNGHYGFSASLNIFDIFSRSLANAGNREYILKYISKNIASVRGFYSLDFFIDGSIRILQKLLELDSGLSTRIFPILQDLLKDQQNEILYVKSSRDKDHQKKIIGQLLSQLFDKSDTNLKKQIAFYAANTFDLIHDHSKSPGSVFSILSKHITDDLNKIEERLQWIANVLLGQYAKFYEGNLNNGWDHMGSTGAFMGRNYSVKDRLFVTIILEIALNKYFEHSHSKAWEFIKQKCITPQNLVSKNKPDFLNRAAIPVVLKQYLSDDSNASKEALGILKEFILSTKGIPVKFEIIYQHLRRDHYSDDQKWELVEISLIEKYEKLPITPFVEQLVTDLVQKGHVKAREALENWFSKPEYFRKHRIVDFAIPNIETFLDSDLSFAIALFEKFIGNEAFINKHDEFDTYDAAVVLQKIVERDEKSGLSILKNLIQIEKPTTNQQILISHGFFHHRNPNDKEDVKVLSNIYNSFVRPNLARFSDPQFLTHSHSRASFLQFARKMAISEMIEEALEIVKAFLNDPDPYLPNQDPDDPEDKYNEHKRILDGDQPSSITSVRGNVAWTLASCPAIPSRNFIQEIIQLTEYFLNDKNWYVKHMACFSLTNLARNRLSVMPPEKKKLFLNDDTELALKMAKKIESMAFKFFEQVAGADAKVQKALAETAMSTLSHIRALNQEEANSLLLVIQKSSSHLKEKFEPFLIFLAEFRSGSYQNWSWKLNGYYDDLQDFDAEPFKKLLEQWTIEESPEIRSKLAWEYWALVQDAYQNKFEDHFPIALRYLDLAADKYDHGVFENIYRFIDYCIDVRFDECFSLWKKCLKIEKSFFDKHFTPYQMHWWPHHYNGQTLLKIREKVGIDEMITWIEFLSQYPEGSRLEDLRTVIEDIVHCKNLSVAQITKVDSIFDNLINRRKEITYSDLKETWVKRKVVI